MTVEQRMDRLEKRNTRYIFVKNAAGKTIVSLGANDGGDGLISTQSAKGKRLVHLVYVFNKTGEFIAEIRADEYDNGLVGAWNRNGKGRTLKPGP